MSDKWYAQMLLGILAALFVVFVVIGWLHWR